MRHIDEVRSEELKNRLQTFSVRVTPLPGIARADALDSLVRQMIDSLHRIEFVRRLGQRPIDPRRKDPHNALFDPVRAAWLYHNEGDSDEAAWLTFLSTHFGFHKRVGWELTRRVYGALGSGPIWTWTRTSSNLPEFRQWYVDNAAGLAGVPFGNHRKYESIRPDAENNLADTISSYVAWVGLNRGFRLLVADAAANSSNAPKAVFHRLYRDCPIVQFGRTAKFDFLTMIGKLGIADIEPPYPYLVGASGPVVGAKLLLTDDPKALISNRDLTDAVVQIGEALGVGMQVMEDSLCNWQKSQYAYLPFRG
ncbi:hypothetical protein [Brevundimonas sp. P7753]|jgi:hypothetical protein|uniref:alpha-glutamyl/putrescinyl thymine pyrophosphorylase clade 3 protein n=1 Tax=Brevundimonas sp. P7753 TaxID=2726982 RepID=UPI0015BF8D23|nr:hypothetical protein [Brevundimonas sp. P7753]NWE53361.1 hypothetical protein [Brevundimonas sp. P7753]